MLGLLSAGQTAIASRPAGLFQEQAEVALKELPNKPGSLKFAVIGDNGTGETPQYEVGKQMLAWHGKFPFVLAVMMGDNIYGSDRPQDFQQKFELPYKPLLDAGVKFYASLGNHDSPEQRFYKFYNMDGKRYYSFKAPAQDVRFFALESTYMDKDQLAVAREGARRITRRLEDHVLPPSALLVGAHARIGGQAARGHRTVVHQVTTSAWC